MLYIIQFRDRDGHLKDTWFEEEYFTDREAAENFYQTIIKENCDDFDYRLILRGCEPGDIVLS